MGSQLELRLDWSAIWQEYRQLIRRVIDVLGVKQCAFDLDVAPSQLMNAVEERERNLPMKWLPYLLVNAPSELGDEFIGKLAALRGMEVSEARAPSPEEELSALKAALAEELGTGARAAVLQKAAVIHRGRRKR